MSRTKTVQAGDGWEVWIGLGNEPDPRDEGESFIIGIGETREEAVKAALKDLLENLAALRLELV